MTAPAAILLGAVAALFVLAGAFSLGVLIGTAVPNLHKIGAALSGRGWFGDA